MTTMQGGDTTTIFVLGHMNPDVDSVVSGTLMAELLVWSGERALFVVVAPLDAITEAVRARLGIPQPPLVTAESLRGARVFLVDHNTPLESFRPTEAAAVAETVTVVGIVDHHVDAGYTGCRDKEIRLAGSASQLVYERMVRCGYPGAASDPRIARWVMTALAVDTACLLTTKTTPGDRALMEHWKAITGVTDAELMQTCIFESVLPDDSPAKLAANGHKAYALTARKWRVRSSYAEVVESADWKDAAIQRAIAQLEAEISSGDAFDLGVFVVRDFGRRRTWARVVGPLASDVMRLHGDGSSMEIAFDYLAGRATDVMPLLMNLLEKLNAQRDGH
jgi:inorganic pyrophosphatase/exopolyphosphatase